jgi:hypothetical protein
MVDSTQSWPALHVRKVAVGELTASPDNARRHDESQLARIAASIERYGFTAPILADESGVVIAGHARLAAALRLGLDSVPVAYATGWTDEQRRAYALADNRLAELSSWDEATLATELTELSALGADLESIGFDAADLERLTGDAGSEAQFTEIATHPIGDRFWLSIRGPISLQSLFLSAFKVAAAGNPDIEIDIGSVQLE